MKRKRVQEETSKEQQPTKKTLKRKLLNPSLLTKGILSKRYKYTSNKRKINDELQSHYKKQCKYVQPTQYMLELYYCRMFNYGEYRPIHTVPNVLAIYG